MAQIIKDVDLKEIKKEESWFQKKGKKVAKWCDDHKEILIPLTPVVVGAGIDIAKMYLRSRNNKAEKALKDNYIYDSSCRHYYELKTKPTSKEWLEIDNRIKGGELLGNILNEMNLVK